MKMNPYRIRHESGTGAGRKNGMERLANLK